MKKYIVISIIAVVALLPFAVWADTGAVATSQLTFASVINTLITDNWGDLELTQDMIGNIAGIAGSGGGTFPIAWGGTSPNITVTVQALSNFKVYGSYVSDPDGAISFTNPAATLGLSDAFTGYLAYYDVPGLDTLVPPNTGDYGAGTVFASMTDLSWTGTNNIASGGESRDYDVTWDPSQLKGDLNTSSTIDFKIYFVVTDPTT